MAGVVQTSRDEAGLASSRDQELQSRLATTCGELQPSDIHVLLVDDEPLSRLVVGNLLRKCSYKVTVVESGPQAMEILRRSVPGTFQLILTDVMMPEVDGLDLLRYVRSSSALVDLPVIMMSANEQQATVFEAIRGGAEEYLLKPVTKKEVQNIWQYVWKRASATAAAAAAAAAADNDEAAGVKRQGGGGSSRGSPSDVPPSRQLPLLPPPSQQAEQQRQQQRERPGLSPQPAGQQQPHRQPQQQPRGAQPGGGASGGCSSSSSKAKGGKLLLSQWLQRRNRVIDPKESVWVFCETLLLLHKAEQAAGPAAVPPSFVRPSKLMLHATGRVTFAPGAAGGGAGPRAQQQQQQQQQPLAAAEDEEERLYRSPEEEAAAGCLGSCPDVAAGLAAGCREVGLAAAAAAAAADAGAGSAAGSPWHRQGTADERRPPPPPPPPQQQQQQRQQQPGRGSCGSGGAQGSSSRCYSFSLGVLFFDLFWAPPEGARAQALSDLRARVLPLAFLRQRPQEAAFVLTLLHPDPSVRPAVAELVSGELLGGVCDALRARHAAQAQAERQQEGEGLVFFLRTLQARKQQELGQVQQQAAALEQGVAAVRAALAAQAPGGGALAALAPPAAAGPGAAGSPCGAPRQQHRLQQQPAAAGLQRGGPAAAPGAGVRSDDDSDDAEERRREARAKRRRGPPQAVRVGLSPGPPAADGGAQGEAWGGGARGAGPSPADHHAPDQAPDAGVQHPGHQLQQRRPHAPAAEAGAAVAAPPAPGAAEAAPSSLVPEGLAGCWDMVLRHWDDLEAAFFRHRARWQQQQEEAAAAQQQQQQQQPGAAAPRRSSAGGGGGGAVAASAGVGDGGPLAAAAPPGGPAGAAAGAAGAAAGGGAAASGAARRLDDGGSAAVAQLPVFLRRFGEDLLRASRVSRLVVRGFMRSSGDALGASDLLCGLGLDRDEEYFATAGVSKRVRVYEYASLVGEGAAPGPAGMSGVQYPVLDLASRSRLSSLAWSGYVKGHLATSDYEGVVQLWDVHAGQDLAQFEEHAKRAWAVDFCPRDPSRLVSGSDDGTVKVWSINQEASVATVALRANVCSVAWAPDNPHLVAAGAANYRAYLLDLRHAAAPLAVAAGHRKAVSYVRWLDGGCLVSASTDNTLRLWDLQDLLAGGGGGSSRVLAGHANEKNFIGLAVSPGGGYIACGSETNEVFAYHRALQRPLARHAFWSGLESDLDTMSALAQGGGPPQGGQFVSAAAWATKHHTLLAANSAGHVKVLELL